ncbi:uncharacterized protein LOC135480290 [Liolophura sinensis]|uniref:uncharacterized protein LOC135480290 n=1 Tax=Liolophura sinensis TaxID=3198878 RepID=UPI0031595B28
MALLTKWGKKRVRELSFPGFIKKLCLISFLLGVSMMVAKVTYLDQNEGHKELFELRLRVTELKKLLESKTKITREIPEARELGRNFNLTEARKGMEKNVTVVMFSHNEDVSCLKSRLDNVLQEYPNIKVIISSTKTIDIPFSQNVEYLPNTEKEGKALATMIDKVKSPYFLYLSSSVQLPPQNSDISVSWLLHALEKIPELDFIGGSFLRNQTGARYPVLEVPCYRLRMCNWTLSQTFEYRYSVDDMMVCEETSSSFMGRKKKVIELGQFDSNLDAMATTDFFWRVKGKAVTGLRPEVQFTVSKKCFPPSLPAATEADLKFAFMKKYELYIVRDNFKREVKALDSKHYSSLKRNYGYNYNRDGYFASPMYARGLLLDLELAADFLESKNISYFIDSGVPLGGVKSGGLLPWDVDIDLGFFYDWKPVQEGLDKFCKEKGIPASVKSEPLGGGRYKIYLRAAGEFGYNTMYQQPAKELNEKDLMMYVYIHGRKYPVKTYLFASFRVMYGIKYLEMRGPRGRMNCRTKGHHACLPSEFSKGGGHWRDYYCEL